MKNEIAKNYRFNRYVFGVGVALLCIGTVQADRWKMACTSEPGFTFTDVENRFHQGHNHVCSISNRMLATYPTKIQDYMHKHMGSDIPTNTIVVEVGENIEALTDIKKTTLGGTVTGFLPAGPIKYNQLTQITGTNSGTPWIIRKLNPDESAYRSGVWEVTGTGYLKGYNAVKGYYLCTQWEECSTCSVS